METRSSLRALLLAGVVLVGAAAAAALLLLFAVVGVGAQEYTIGPGDVLKIVVWGQEDLSRDYPVTQDGFVPFPFLGRVRAAGLTTTQLAQSLRDKLEKDYLVNPQVIVSVKEFLSKKVSVLGEAEKPGLFYLTGPTTVLEVISKAGGLGKSAGKEVVLVRLQRNADGTASSAMGTTILRLDIRKVQAGDVRENILLENDDTLFVPKAEATFFVFGQVKKPGAYPLEKETNVLEGITIAGGFTDKAAPGRTRVIRTTVKGQQTITVDVNDILRKGDRDRAPRIVENDVIVVPESFF